MIVYRLETEAGLGAYSIPKPRPYNYNTPSYLTMEVNDYRGNKNTPHPAPAEDGLSRSENEWHAIDHDEYCGFESLDQLQAWFYIDDHDPGALDRLGLRVAAYKVHGRYVRKGGRQVVFKRDKAELILARSTNVDTYVHIHLDRLPR